MGGEIMMDLTAISGLPLGLDDDGRLVLGPDIVVEEARVRLLEELAPVALDPEACRGSRQVAYYMYNGVYLRRDAGLLAGLPVRYELTLMPPYRIGRELAKTFGHLHTSEPQSGLTYPEICEVLAGTAHFLFQTFDPGGPSADLAFYVEVGAGQKIILPSGLDHLTINAGPEPLLFSDVIAAASRGIYERFIAAHGAAYMELATDGGPAGFVRNAYYRALPPLRQAPARDYPGVGLATGRPLYSAFVEQQGLNWPFLIEPTRIELDLHDLKAVFKP